jgi:hypothetical protein
VPEQGVGSGYPGNFLNDGTRFETSPMFGLGIDMNEQIEMDADSGHLDTSLSVEGNTRSEPSEAVEIPSDGGVSPELAAQVNAIGSHVFRHIAPLEATNIEPSSIETEVLPKTESSAKPSATPVAGPRLKSFSYPVCAWDQGAT